MTRPTVSVVVTTFRRRDRLAAVIAPLLEDPATDEVVVVDDAGGDGTPELLRHLAGRDQRVRPLVLPANRGQPRARAAGISAAAGEVVLSLDDDVVAAPGLVTGHRAHHAGERGLVVVGYMPTALPPTRRPGQYATYDYAAAYEHACNAYVRDPSKVLRALWGGNFSLRREDFLAAVDPDDLPLRYHEDQDLGLRFQARGLRGRFDRALRAQHQHVRPWPSYLREGWSSGVGVQWLHRRHPEVLGPLDLADATRSWSAGMRALARAGQRRDVRRLELAVLQAATRASGAARLWAVESLLAGAAQNVELWRGLTEPLPPAP